MDLLTFSALAIAIIPAQILIFLSIFWFKSKFDKYESIAVNVIQKYTQSQGEHNAHVQDIDSIKAQYNILRDELSSIATYDDISDNLSTDDIMKLYNKIHKDAMSMRKKYIIDGSICAIADTLKNKYQSEGIADWVDKVRGRLNSFGFNDIIDDRLGENPLAGIVLDLLSCAWIHNRNR